MLTTKHKPKYRPTPKDQNAWSKKRDMLEAAVVCALPHRRIAGQVASVVGENWEMAEYNTLANDKYQKPYFTHVNIGCRRRPATACEDHHRGAQREIMTELAELEILRIQPYRVDKADEDGQVHRGWKFWINWDMVNKFLPKNWKRKGKLSNGRTYHKQMQSMQAESDKDARATREQAEADRKAEAEADAAHKAERAAPGYALKMAQGHLSYHQMCVDKAPTHNARWKAERKLNILLAEIEELQNNQS